MATKRYIKKLLVSLTGVQFEGCCLEVEHQGAVCITVTDDVAVYATPDYEERNSLSIEVMSSDGDMLECTEHVVPWTGDLDADVATWRALVAPVVERLRAAHVKTVDLSDAS